MARLYKTSDAGAVLLMDQLQVADTFWSRGKGLLGRQSLQPNEALWIKRCNNIHTFFMKMKIDCIFLNQKLEIQRIVSSVPAFRFVGPIWKASSVIEMPSGFAEKNNLKPGDHLYVVG